MGIWYATLIGAVLLIATGLYAWFLHGQVEEWRDAADQLAIGQDLLRADRDEILQQTRDQEAALSTLEAARAQDQLRLDALEGQRHRLQASVLQLTQDLAASEERVNGATSDAVDPGTFQRLQREHDLLERKLGEREGEIARLEDAVADKDAALAEAKDTRAAAKAEIEALRAERTALDEAKAAIVTEREALAGRLAERQREQQRRQIIRGHRASLGEVKPYIAEVGPEDWSLIESWLALHLRRPMAVPDLSARGWSYEGSRLLGSATGPPMVMLLYADAEERPISLTIALDRRGETPLTVSQHGGLTWIEWREERHAFILAGETGEEDLKPAAVDLLNQPPRLSAAAPVPTSRYLRPSFRPADQP